VGALPTPDTVTAACDAQRRSSEGVAVAVGAAHEAQRQASESLVSFARGLHEAQRRAVETVVDVVRAAHDAQRRSSAGVGVVVSAAHAAERQASESVVSVVRGLHETQRRAAETVVDVVRTTHAAQRQTAEGLAAFALKVKSKRPAAAAPVFPFAANDARRYDPESIAGGLTAIIRASQAHSSARFDSGRYYQQLIDEREVLRSGLAQQVKTLARLIVDRSAVATHTAWQLCHEISHLRSGVDLDVVGSLLDEADEQIRQEANAAVMQPPASALVRTVRVVRRLLDVLDDVEQRVRETAAYRKLIVRPPHIIYRQLPWFITHGCHPPHQDMPAAS
jgi:hypothetical protein